MSEKLSIRVCTGPTCSLVGSDALSAWCKDLLQAGLALTVGETPCTGNCDAAPVVVWNGECLTEMSPEGLTQRLIAEDVF